MTEYEQTVRVDKMGLPERRWPFPLRVRWKPYYSQVWFSSAYSFELPNECLNDAEIWIHELVELSIVQIEKTTTTIIELPQLDCKVSIAHMMTSLTHKSGFWDAPNSSDYHIITPEKFESILLGEN